MVIKVGDRLPDVDLMRLGEKLEAVNVLNYFSGIRVVLFGVPGAFTPQCSVAHVPGFLALLDSFKDKGIDKVACISVNDPFVLDVWSKTLGASGKIDFLGDGNTDFVRAVGLQMDASVFGMGMRSKRYSMLVESGEVKSLFVEQDPATVSVSGAEAMLATL